MIWIDPELNLIKLLQEFRGCYQKILSLAFRHLVKTPHQHAQAGDAQEKRAN